MGGDTRIESQQNQQLNKVCLCQQHAQRYLGPHSAERRAASWAAVSPSFSLAPRLTSCRSGSQLSSVPLQGVSSARLGPAIASARRRAMIILQNPSPKAHEMDNS